MQIETVGHYQLHLIAHELPGNKWDPFIAIFKFDDEAQDFKCVSEKQRAAARQIGRRGREIDRFQARDRRSRGHGENPLINKQHAPRTSDGRVRSRDKLKLTGFCAYREGAGG